jgi:hypothetical protein
MTPLDSSLGVGGRIDVVENSKTDVVGKSEKARAVVVVRAQNGRTRGHG